MEQCFEPLRVVFTYGVAEGEMQVGVAMAVPGDVTGEFRQQVPLARQNTAFDTLPSRLVRITGVTPSQSASNFFDRGTRPPRTA